MPRKRWFEDYESAFAITIRYPRAHFVVAPERMLREGEVRQRVENRTWDTPWRGPLLIHASRSLLDLQPMDGKGGHRGLFRRSDFPDYHFGCLIGMVDLVEVCPAPPDGKGGFTLKDGHFKRFPWIYSHVHATGPFIWVLERPRMFKTPIPFKGKVYLFKVPLHLVEKAAEEAIR